MTIHCKINLIIFQLPIKLSLWSLGLYTTTKIAICYRSHCVKARSHLKIAMISTMIEYVYYKQQNVLFCYVKK